MRTDHRLRYAAVEIVGVRTLRGYDRNARTHSDAQVAQLAAAIERFGFTSPLLVDESGTLIAGYGRLAAALKIGMDEVPVIRVAGLSEQERTAVVLADNRIALDAGRNVRVRGHGPFAPRECREEGAPRCRHEVSSEARSGGQAGRLSVAAQDEPDCRTTNVHRTDSKHWKRWHEPANCCLVPFISFSEFNEEAAQAA